MGDEFGTRRQYPKTFGHLLSFCILLMLCLWIFPEEPAFALENEPLAVIISLEGTVNIKQRSTTRLAKEEDTLYEGDIITTDRLSRVSLLYLGEELVRIPEEKTLKITAERLSIPDQEKSVRLKHVLSAAYVGLKSSLFPSPVLSSPGAARKWRHFIEAGIIDLVNPAATKVMTPYPSFEWVALEGGRRYELSVFDGLGRPVWKHTTTESKITYPQNAPALAPGDYYFWQVKSMDGREGEGPVRKNLYASVGLTYFIVLPAEDAAEIQRKVAEAKQIVGAAPDETSTLLLALYYEKQQLYGDAQKEYEQLRQFNPSNNIYRNMLANLYVKVGRKWAAADLFGPEKE